LGQDIISNIRVINMSEDSIALQEAIKQQWGGAKGEKVQRYVGKFWDRQRRGRRVTAVVKGNHGNYTVVIEAQEAGLWSACSCYIGKHGYCHHCAALGLTFLAEPDSFVEVKLVARTAVADLDTLEGYLNSVTLDDLTKQLKARGITQKAFCEAVGMGSGHLTAVKTAELRNRHYHELGAIKLAILWVLEQLQG
jgi:uncharacterized Zn finger protein